MHDIYCSSINDAINAAIFLSDFRRNVSNYHRISTMQCSEICVKNGQNLSLSCNSMVKLVKTGKNLNIMEKTSSIKIIVFH